MHEKKIEADACREVVENDSSAARAVVFVCVFDLEMEISLFRMCKAAKVVASVGRSNSAVMCSRHCVSERQ